MHRVTSLGLYGPPQIARIVMLTTYVKWGLFLVFNFILGFSKRMLVPHQVSWEFNSSLCFIHLLVIHASTFMRRTHDAAPSPQYEMNLMIVPRKRPLPVCIANRFSFHSVYRRKSMLIIEKIP